MSEFQMAILFPFVPMLGLVLAYFFVDIIMGPDDDDDDRGKGMMQPVYQYVPASNPA